MSNNGYRFFQNRECEFFPCHKVKNEAEFNCLFCYCPLYHEEKCIGNPDYVISRKGQRIKDCSRCILVHSPGGYDKVISHLQREDELVRVDLVKLKDRIEKRLEQITHINDMDDDMRSEHKMNTSRVLDRVLDGQGGKCEVKVLLQHFAPECIREGCLEIGGRQIECGILSKLDSSLIERGYMYVFHAPTVDMEGIDSVLDQYYMEAYQVACMDVIRLWIQEFLARKYSVYEKRYCSPSFGPGYYGMGMESVKPLLDLMDSRKAGVSWNGEQMSPKMSLTGVYLISDEDIFSAHSDCADCIGNKGGCEFCQKGI